MNEINGDKGGSWLICTGGITLRNLHIQKVLYVHVEVSKKDHSLGRQKHVQIARPRRAGHWGHLGRNARSELFLFHSDPDSETKKKKRRKEHRVKPPDAKIL